MHLLLICECRKLHKAKQKTIYNISTLFYFRWLSGEALRWRFEIMSSQKNLLASRAVAFAMTWQQRLHDWLENSNKWVLWYKRSQCVLLWLRVTIETRNNALLLRWTMVIERSMVGVTRKHLSAKALGARCKRPTQYKGWTNDQWLLQFYARKRTLHCYFLPFQGHLKAVQRKIRRLYSCNVYNFTEMHNH